MEDGRERTDKKNPRRKTRGGDVHYQGRDMTSNLANPAQGSRLLEHPGKVDALDACSSEKCFDLTLDLGL